MGSVFCNTGRQPFELEEATAGDAEDAVADTSVLRTPEAVAGNIDWTSGFVRKCFSRVVAQAVAGNVGEHMGSG
jgi:hypothetical protein